MFTIHRYAPGESLGDDVSELLVDVFVGERYSPKRGAGNLADSAQTSRGIAWVARGSNGRAIGTVFLVEPGSPFRQVAEGDELEVHLMAVRQTERRQGVADALLLACLAEARQKGSSSIVLSTQPVMQAAQALYEKHGFSRVPGRDWKRADKRTFIVYTLPLGVH